MLIFINCGGDRCAWLLLDNDGTKITLKTRKYRKDFTKGFYDAAAKDGLVMERLTKSPYVAGTYGYCGLSQLVEYSEGGNLHDLIKTSRMHDQDPQTPIDRLKVGIQVATAVADLHSFEEDGIPSITHNDLCCHQFILVDGIYKLNDFHLGQFLHKDKNTNQVCQSRTNYNPRVRTHLGCLCAYRSVRKVRECLVFLMPLLSCVCLLSLLVYTASCSRGTN